MEKSELRQTLEYEIATYKRLLEKDDSRLITLTLAKSQRQLAYLDKLEKENAEYKSNNKIATLEKENAQYKELVNDILERIKDFNKKADLNK